MMANAFLFHISTLFSCSSGHLFLREHFNKCIKTRGNFSFGSYKRRHKDSIFVRHAHSMVHTLHSRQLIGKLRILVWKSKEKLLCVRKKVNAGTVERCSDRDSSHRSPLMLPQSREESQRDASRKYREGWG